MPRLITAAVLAAITLAAAGCSHKELEAPCSADEGASLISAFAPGDDTDEQAAAAPFAAARAPRDCGPLRPLNAR